VTDKIQKSGDTPLVRGHGLAPTEAGERRALDYIKRVEWRFAKTMPEHPHCYTVVTWTPELEAGFRWLAGMIAKHSRSEQWTEGRYSSYLYLGRHKYWIMSGPNVCILINRTGAVASGPSKALE